MWLSLQDKMKSAVLCVLSLVLVVVAALPTLQQQDGGVLAVEEYAAAPEEVAHGLRYRRATCDLLSFSSKWVTPNHAGCALHCLAKGYKGGNCKNTVCHCRR